MTTTLKRVPWTQSEMYCRKKGQLDLHTLPSLDLCSSGTSATRHSKKGFWQKPSRSNSEQKHQRQRFFRKLQKFQKCLCCKVHYYNVDFTKPKISLFKEILQKVIPHIQVMYILWFFITSTEICIF